MRTTILVSTICLGLTAACATQNKRELDPKSPEEIDTELDTATATAPNVPEKTDSSRVHVDENILQACGLSLPQAFFEVDSAELDVDDRNELHDVADCLTDGALADATVGVIGHADPRGTDEFNEELGRERATSVADYLERCGVDRARLDTDSMGERLASADPDDWPADRRVDIILRSAPN